MSANEALERRIDELCSENERLRQQVASIIGRSFRTADKMDCLDTENAKLRGLVRDMWAYITEPVGKRNNLKERLARFDDIADRMRELGVDDG